MAKEVIDASKMTEEVKVQVSKAVEVVNELSVVTPEDYTRAVEIGSRIKQIAKAITARKEEITKPLNEALKSARSLFKPIEDGLDEAEATLKAKMITYKDSEREKIKEARETHQPVPMEELTAKTVSTEKGRATEKFIPEYVVVDKSKIPLEFLEPNMVAIKQSFKEGKPVDGVEERRKSIISF